MSVDLYERCVAEVLGIPSEEVTTAQRMAAKGACFAVSVHAGRPAAI